MFRSITIVAAVGLLSAACTDKPDPFNPVGGTGVVRGIIYIDRNADEALTQGFDVAATGAVARLVNEGSGDTIASATAGTDGTFIMRDVPVGEYQMVSLRGVLGDTIELQDIDSVRVRVARGDTLTRIVRYGYPSITVAAARILGLNRRVVVRGIALNALGADTSIHIQDPTGAIRATRVIPASAVQAGDSIRMVGVIGSSNGSPVIDLPLTTVLAGARPLPPPDSLSTRLASTADAGRLVDARVRIGGAEVVDTATLPFHFRMTVDDGSGRVDILYRREFAGAFPQAAFQIGATVSILDGLLVAEPGGRWQIKPRGPTEVLASFPTRTIADVRTVELGKRVQISGIGLNRFGVFSDSTIHVQDATGAIRAIRVTQLLNSIPDKNDSLRVQGTTANVEGRLALLNATVTVVSPQARIVPIDSVSTLAASTAQNGARADSHVRIAGANILDTATVNGDRLLGVDDGSGRVVVHLSRFVQFTPGQYIPGGVFRGAGVLVPVAGSAEWRIKPRQASEASVTFQTLTIAQVRALADGTPTFVDGVALNASTAFGDSTVHMYDGTGSIRALRVRTVVSAGDSIRVQGTKTTNNGQPVLSSLQSVTVLRAGIELPTADSISLARIATADDGARDAGLATAGGEVVGFEPLPTGDVLVTLQDASGTARVWFRKSVGSPGASSPGTVMKVTGVLVPTTTGTWQIMPRAASDVQSDYQEVSIADARELAIGKTVYIRGIALNSYLTFGDSTIHVTGPTGSIRVVRHPNTTISAGDSVRVLGIRATRNGQPVLNGGNSTILRTAVGLPTPDSIQTGEAATALDGALDADAVAVSGTILTVDSASVGPGLDLTFTVADGSAAVKVVIDKDLDLVTGLYVKNAFVRVRGVLIPDGNTGKWLLKPRSAADIAISTPPPPPPDGGRPPG